MVRRLALEIRENKGTDCFSNLLLSIGAECYDLARCRSSELSRRLRAWEPH